jgi:NADH-ubiquinone oxidoreductase chain 6
MIIKTILYNFLPFLTLALSVFSITAKNPVISVTYLISTFVSAACFLLIIGIEFIGISYIIVYIGAIAVLFLFVIMMINIKMTDILEIGSQYTKTLPLALSIISLFSFVFTTSVPNFKIFSILNLSTFFNNSDVLWNIKDHMDYISSVVSDRIDSSVFLIQNANEIAPQFAEMMMVQFLQIEAIGLHLYTYACILFITSSLILLLAMFAAIIISRKK